MNAILRCGAWFCSIAVIACCGPLAAQQRGGDLPSWFEQHRVQAHFENGIQDDLAGLYKELHPAIHDHEWSSTGK